MRRHAGISIFTIPELNRPIGPVIPDRPRGPTQSAGRPVEKIVQCPSIQRVVAEHAADRLTQSTWYHFATQQRRERPVFDFPRENFPVTHLSDRALSQPHEKHRSTKSVDIVSDRALPAPDGGSHRGFDGLEYCRLPPGRRDRNTVAKYKVATVSSSGKNVIRADCSMGNLAALKERQGRQCRYQQRLQYPL